MSRGFASIAVQIYMLDKLDAAAKEHALEGMRIEGLPTNMNDLITKAASTILEQKMGWYRKNQFLGMLFGSMVSMGVSPIDANFIKGQVELLAR
jgi:hypothetical protein